VLTSALQHSYSQGSEFDAFNKLEIRVKNYKKTILFYQIALCLLFANVGMCFIRLLGPHLAEKAEEE
jgi:hypothetical protein